MNTLKDSLFKYFVIPVVSVFLISLLCFWLIIPSFIEQRAIEQSITASERKVQEYKILRGYYTKNVIKKVIANSDIKGSFNHQQEQKTIPLPATLIHDLSSEFEDKGLSLKLYSAFPFPNRNNRKLDEFENNAWSFLKTHPEESYHAVEYN